MSGLTEMQAKDEAKGWIQIAAEFERRLTTAEAERDEARESYQECWDDLQKVQSRHKELHAALETFGHHKPGCEYYNPPGCICGLAAALRGSNQ